MGLQALADLVHDGEERFSPERERSLPIHPVRGDADGDRRGHHDLREERERGLLSHQRDAGGVVDHRQVLVVLFRAARRDDHRLERVPFDGLPELLARALPQEDLARAHVGAPGERDRLRLPRGSGTSWRQHANRRGSCTSKKPAAGWRLFHARRLHRIGTPEARRYRLDHNPRSRCRAPQSSGCALPNSARECTRRPSGGTRRASASRDARDRGARERPRRGEPGEC